MRYRSGPVFVIVFKGTDLGRSPSGVRCLMSLRLAGTLSGPLQIPYSSIRFSRSPASSPRGCRVERRGCILRASAGVVNGFSGKFSRSARRPAGGAKKGGGPEGPPPWREAPRASATTLPSADCTAVRRAMAGLAAGFGMGPGDPRLRGRARAGRCPRSGPSGGALKAAWRF